MTDDFIRIVKEEFLSWSEEYEQYILEKNREIKEQNDRIKKIHELLIDEKVREFAKYIDYKEKETSEYLEIHNSLYDYLKTVMSRYMWPNDISKKDNYPIYCFYKSERPVISCVTGKRLCDFTDQYLNLQQYGNSFGPSDKCSNGKNRERFRIENIDKIIYPPKGESFTNENVFFRIQSEFVEETLRTDQNEAKKMILKKYGRR